MKRAFTLLFTVAAIVALSVGTAGCASGGGGGYSGGSSDKSSSGQREGS